MIKEDVQPSQAQSTQTRIVQAALNLIQTRGIGDFTLEKVAAATGISKGGLLYHFASKEALAEAMNQYLIARFEENLQGELAASSQASSQGSSYDSSCSSAQTIDAARIPGAWTRAYLVATLKLEAEVAEHSRTLFLLNGPYPQYLTLLQKKYAEWQQAIESDGLAPEVATLARMVADGIWFADVFQLAPPNPVLRQQILTRLFTMLEG